MLCEHSFACARHEPDMPKHEIAQLARSIAMLPPEAPSGLRRETGLMLLVLLMLLMQLAAVTAERDQLLAELVALGYG